MYYCIRYLPWIAFALIAIWTLYALSHGKRNAQGVFLLLDHDHVSDESTSHNLSPHPRRARVNFPLSVTSRNLASKITSTMELPLVAYALTSIIETIEPDVFDYGIYVGADQGDIWFDNKNKTDMIHEWWVNAFQKQWPSHPIPELRFFVYPNTASRNVWAVNYVTQVAFENGYDYLYRINDDTVLQTRNWTSIFVNELAQFKPLPNVGVTGPWDDFQEGTLLTHSFVHRQHLHVFGVHFNFLYGNWFSDNWIQFVYTGPYPPSFGHDARMVSIRRDVKVYHLVLPSRYEVKGNSDLHERQLAIDKENLRQFIEKRLTPTWRFTNLKNRPGF